MKATDKLLLWLADRCAKAVRHPRDSKIVAGLAIFAMTVVNGGDTLAAAYQQFFSINQDSVIRLAQDSSQISPEEALEQDKLEAERQSRIIREKLKQIRENPWGEKEGELPPDITNLFADIKKWEKYPAFYNIIQKCFSMFHSLMEREYKNQQKPSDTFDHQQFLETRTLNIASAVIQRCFSSFPNEGLNIKDEKFLKTIEAKLRTMNEAQKHKRIQTIKAIQAETNRYIEIYLNEHPELSFPSSSAPQQTSPQTEKNLTK